MSTLMKVIVLFVVLVVTDSTLAHPPDSCQCDTVSQYYYSGPFGPTYIDSVSEEDYQVMVERLGEKLSDPDYLFRIGCLALDYDHLDTAIMAFERLERGEYTHSDNDSISSYSKEWSYYLGEVWEKEGDLAKSREYYKTWGNPYFVHLIDSRIYEREGDISNAIVELLKAQKVKLYEGTNIEPYRLLAELFLREKWYEFATYWATKYLYEMELESINPEAMWGFTEEAFDSAHELLKRIDSAKTADDLRSPPPDK